MSAMRVCVPGAQYSLWRANKFLFLVVWSGDLCFWRESKVNSRCYWRCLLSWQVLFQQTEMRISWWLCNNSPRSIYDCGKCGAWLFVHKVPFMLQEHVKTTKTDRTRFFSAKKKMNLLPDTYLFIKFPSRKKNNSPPITVTCTKKG